MNIVLNCKVHSLFVASIHAAFIAAAIAQAGAAGTLARCVSEAAAAGAAAAAALAVAARPFFTTRRLTMLLHGIDTVIDAAAAPLAADGRHVAG